MSTRERSGLRPPAIAVLAVALAGAAAAPGTGAAAQQVDAGRLEVRENGRRIAVESFRVWRVGSTLNAVANVEPAGGGPGEFQVGVRLDADHRPIRYELGGEGDRSVEAVWTGDRVRVHTITTEGERWRELPSRGAHAVLESGVAHHYLVLVHVLRASGGRVAVVVPSRGEGSEASLVAETEDRVTIGDQTIAATRIDLRVGGSDRSVWIDADGRLLRVSDPSTGREAVRLPPR